MMPVSAEIADRLRAHLEDSAQPFDIGEIAGHGLDVLPILSDLLRGICPFSRRSAWRPS